MKLSPVETAGIAFDDAGVVLNGARILRGVTARLERGRLTAIVGPNGAGKSTLLRAVIGAVRLAMGRIDIGGRDLAQLRPRALARAVAFVPQDVRIDFGFRVSEVVAMGRYPHLDALEREGADDRHIVDESLGKLGLEPLRDRDVTTLSEGESQRVLVARALATRAQTLLLDEPVSHLDLSHRLDLLELLGALARDGAAVGIVLHELDLALRFADRLVVIQDGAVAADCDPEEALESGVLARVFGVELERVRGERGESGLIVRRTRN